MDGMLVIMYILPQATVRAGQKILLTGIVFNLESTPRRHPNPRRHGYFCLEAAFSFMPAAGSGGTIKLHESNHHRRNGFCSGIVHSANDASARHAGGVKFGSNSNWQHGDWQRFLDCSSFFYRNQFKRLRSKFHSVADGHGFRQSHWV